MADRVQGADWTAQAHKRGMQTLWRLAAWGCLATLALLVAVMTAYSGAGSHRQAPADQGTTRSRTLPGDVPTRTGDNAEEIRRLNEIVHALTADRDQAFARIAALERNLDSITGSIKRVQQQSGQPAAQAPQSQAVQAAPQPPAQPAPVPVATASPPHEQPAAPGTAPRAEAPPIQVAVTSEQVTYPQRQQAAAPPPAVADATRSTASDGARLATATIPSRPSPPSEPPTAGLGLDIGGAINYEGLRTLWHSTKNSDLALTEDLYPLVTVRENNRTHGIDLRLVIGPIDDMETASRLCAALLAVHRYCQPVAFEGQRLTLNEPPAGKLAPIHHAAPKLDPNKAVAKDASPQATK
ncbi:MAG TPA: hypothetical protein VKW08_05750 [Xanthobacteraceae bacterium]|nr:hypothetical protein [Xanthobacteraceae bacterium]